MAGLNAVARNAMLDGNSAVWPPDTASLHSSDPGAGTSPAAGEISGGSPAYARKAVAWAAASAGSKSASAAPVFDVPGGGTAIGYLGYWRGTTYLGSRPLDAVQTFATQGTYTATAITENLT